MTPEREIEILKMLKERILKDGMPKGLCLELWYLYVEDLISLLEYDPIDTKIKKWTYWSWYSLFRLRSNFAAPPGEIPPRIKYIDNRIKQLENEFIRHETP